MKKDTPWYQSPSFLLPLGWTLLILLAYGRILFHPDLHFACPENDTWNFPVRYWTAQSLSQGHLPLWNDKVAFGVPWLASWATEVFYPGTLLFTWLGLSAWNFSGVLHLFIFSFGLYLFLRKSEIARTPAFLAAATALLNACAVNHLGSNAPMDAMAWIPWVFLGAKECLEKTPSGSIKLVLALSLQILAGYPHLLFYTVLCALVYALVLYRTFNPLVLPALAALALTAAQWLPSADYLYFQAVRLPAVPDNPLFILPLGNLMTLINPFALSKPGLPDYVASPTYFYFDLFSGALPLLLLAALGVIRHWDRSARFWMVGFFILGLYVFGAFHWFFGLIHIPLPSFLEPAKAWVLLNFFEIAAMAFTFKYIRFAEPFRPKLLALVYLFLLFFPLWTRPLERNLTPPNAQLDKKAQVITDHLSSGRFLVLPSQMAYAQLYFPLPNPLQAPHFKYFAGNSNLYTGLPSANFYSSTWPSWGALDASLYYKYGFPYRGHLLDLLGVDLLLMDQKEMPKNFKKVGELDGWGLWRNPASVGDHFLVTAQPKTAGRKVIFTAFAQGKATPLKDLYLEGPVLGIGPYGPGPTGPHYDLKEHKSGFLVITQNALPGWKAWVDGKPIPIYLADGIFQGIPINAQSSAVDLSYEPVSFRLGLFISLLALAGLLAGLLLKT